MIEALTEQDRFFAEVDEAYQKFHANPELMYEYEARQKWLHDQATYIEEARADGLKEGKAEDARNFKKLGVDISIIEKATGLSAKEIEGL